MNDSKPPFYLATGLLLGLGLGYLISVVLFPAQFADGTPAQLIEADKLIYRNLAAQAYSVSNNLDRASARINLLGDESPERELAGAAQRMLAEGKSLAEAEILAKLASALSAADQRYAKGSQEPADAAGIPLFTPDPLAAPEENEITPTSEGIPVATPPPQPTPSPAPTLGAPFELEERLIVCQPGQEPGMIEVQVEDQAGNPVPGVKVDISWQDGEEFFFTGLVQTVNPGYADFQMTSGIEYALRVGEGGEQVRGLSIPECTEDDGDKVSGSVYLRFTQP